MSSKRIADRRVPRIVGTGLIALDVVVKENAPTCKLFAGGTCGNVLAILGYYGWQAYPIGRLADDDYSQVIRRDLERWKVCCDYLSLEPVTPTPVVLEKIRADGRHKFSLCCPGCGRWFPSFRPVPIKSITPLPEPISAPEVFFFDRVSPGALAMARAFKEAGSLIFFEPPSVGHPRHFREAIAIADIVKYSCERMTGLGEIGKLPLPLVEIATLGADGLRIRCSLPGANGNWHTLPGIPAASVRDTAGSGDWMTATLLRQIGNGGIRGLESLKSDRLLDAVRLAQAAASWNCGYEGARGGMYKTNLETLDKLLKGFVESESCDFAPGQLVWRSTDTLAKTICESCASVVSHGKTTRAGARSKKSKKRQAHN